MAQSAAVQKTTKSSGWFLDSQATAHVCYQRELLEDFTSLGKSMDVMCVSGPLISVAGVGKVPLAFNVSGKMEKACLHSVLYAPEHTKNLVSVRTLKECGNDVYYDSLKRKCVIQKDGRVLCYGIAEGMLFRLQEAEELQEGQDGCCAVFGTRLFKLWHLRLGHISESDIRTLEKMCKGLEIKGGNLEFCAEGIAQEIPLPGRFSGTTRPLDLIHSDVGGYGAEKSLSGATCYVTFVDDYSRKSFVYLMRQKDELLVMFKKFVEMAERETGRQVKRFRCSGGIEYQNPAFISFLEVEGISMEITARGSFSICHDGVAERVNLTLLDKALRMMQHAQLQRCFWGAAIKTANYLRNVSPSGSLNSMTPEECWSGTKPNLSHLRVFGCPAYVNVEEKRRERVLFIGYEEGFPGRYLLFNPKTKQVIRSTQSPSTYVEFDERDTWSKGENCC